MFTEQEYNIAHNVLESIRKQYDKEVDLSNEYHILDSIRNKNIIRGIFDCMYLIQLEIDKYKENQKQGLLGRNNLCIYIYDTKYIQNRRIECYEKLTKEQVIEKLSNGISNNNLLEFDLNNKKFTTATAELKAEDFI